MVDDENPYKVPSGVSILSGVINRFPLLFRAAGGIESFLLRKRIASIDIDRPVFVSGLARSGTTIMLEFLNSIDCTASHRYIDYPAVYTPVLWNTMVNYVDFPRGELRERGHRDRIMVNLNSPESMEEIIWTGFFRDLHNPEVINTLDEDSINRSFIRFYREHIKKLLFIRKGSRYISKANYNAVRIPFILNHFNDARFLLLVRDPLRHVCALMKQDEYVREVQKRYPGALKHFNRSKHFEFGIGFSPINTTGERENSGLNELFKRERKTRAWARYWSLLNRHIYQTASRYRDNCMVIRYEDLCSRSYETLRQAADFCGFEGFTDDVAERFAEEITPPSYYSVDLSNEDLKEVYEETHETASLLGYDFRNLS